MNIQQLPVSQIRPDKTQPRRVFQTAALEKLATTLQSTGQINPVEVVEVEDGYQLVTGERRWRAAQLAGMKTIWAKVLPAKAATLLRQIVENDQQEPMTAWEKAYAYDKLRVEQNLTDEELAQQLGISKTTLYTYLSILTLPTDLLAEVKAGTLEGIDAVNINRVKHPTNRAELRRIIQEQGLNQQIIRVLAASLKDYPEHAAALLSQNYQGMTEASASDIIVTITKQKANLGRGLAARDEQRKKIKRAAYYLTRILKVAPPKLPVAIDRQLITLYQLLKDRYESKIIESK